MKRLAIAFFYDEHGIVDDYMPYLMGAIGEFVDKTVFVSNGPIDPDGEKKIRNVADDVIIRENVGFDVWAYKRALEHVGFDKLAEYDEVILYNHTIFGPLYPLSEMFGVMESRKCDFWGITIHGAMVPNPFTGTGRLPHHLNSHFIAVRKKILASREFRDYWSNIPPIEDYFDSILKHESKFTEHFENLGYTCSSYIENKDYSTDYPVMMEVQYAVANRCPIIKRRLFFHDHYFFEENGTDTPQALEVLRATSKYPERLIWQSVIRLSELRNLNVNASLMKILPEQSQVKAIKNDRYGKIAVLAHVYHDDMIEEILRKCDNIPVPYDLVATTDTPEKAAKIKRVAARFKRIKNVKVLVVEMNRGRDMSALVITCRDLLLDSPYDLICRVHTKKTPQVARNIAGIFKKHLFENLLHSRGYVTNLLEEFRAKPWVGVIIPPVLNVSFNALGMSWYSNKQGCQDMISKLGLKVKLDPSTPVAAYGTMFWFRPEALRKMFLPRWDWQLFNEEPNHSDGSLAHVLERMICYVAQDAGYVTLHVANASYAAQSYTVAEFKLDQLIAQLPPNTVRNQTQMLKNWKMAGYPPYGHMDPHRIANDNAVKRSEFKRWLTGLKYSLYPVGNHLAIPFVELYSWAKSRLRYKRNSSDEGK